MADKRRVKPEDLYELLSVGNPVFSPDGKRAAYVVTGISEEKNDYYSNIFVLDPETKESFQWTYGKCRNHSPAWSPDGTRLAFVSNRNGDPQIYVMNTDGGEAKQVTDAEKGAANPVWSPDGKKMAFTVRVKPGETVLKKGKKEEKEEKKRPEPLEVEKMKYKSDARGLFDGRYQHIAVLDLETEDVRLITEGENSFSPQGWSPDGRYFAFSDIMHEGDDLSFHQDIYLLDWHTGKTENITKGRGMFNQCAWSKSGRYLAVVGHGQEFKNATLNKIWIYDLQEGRFDCLSEGWDIAVGDFMIGDFLQGVAAPRPVWDEDDRGLYFLASREGNTNLYYSDLKGNLRQLTKMEGHVYGFSVSKEGRAIVSAAFPVKPGELYEADLERGSLVPLTAVNRSFLERVELSEPEEIRFAGAEGETVEGWLMKPAGFREGNKYPLILEIHGGPHMMYGNTYFHEFQCLASQGFAVLYTNPRGSHGYGQKFVNAVRGDYGGNDYRDLMLAVDYVLNRFSFIDENRLGVTGGSYGGFMTNWIVGHTNRFKAAVTQRSISNWISFYGVSDIGYYFNEFQHMLDPSDFEGLWKISPLAYVDHIETPLLILHSEKDYRCPIEQAEQLFIALKHRKKPVKFVRFPEANHELSRSGKPNLRIRRLHYIADWFKQYLLP